MSAHSFVRLFRSFGRFADNAVHAPFAMLVLEAASSVASRSDALMVAVAFMPRTARPGPHTSRSDVSSERVSEFNRRSATAAREILFPPWDQSHRYSLVIAPRFALWSIPISVQLAAAPPRRGATL